jgi:PAS domain S-box-containing protein
LRRLLGGGRPREDLLDSLEHMLDGYAVLRAVREAGQIVDFEWEYINAVGAATYGLAPAEIVGRRLRDLVPGIVASGVFEERRGVVESGEPLLHARLDSGDAGIQGTFDSRVWKHGDGYAIIWRDVTVPAAAQAAARESHERFRSAVHHLPDAVSVFEAVRDDAGAIADFRWVYANPAAARMTGHPLEDLLGGMLLDVLPNHRTSGTFETYRRVVESGVPHVDETLWHDDVWGDGGRRRRRAFDVRATKVGDGFVVVTREVTEMRETAERDSLRRSLESAERERRRWARELHDATLQNLAALKLSLSTARRSGDPACLDAAAAETIEHLGAEMTYLRALLTELRPAALDDSGLAAALAALADRATALYGLDVSVTVDLDLHARPAPELETTVYRIVQEALTNACKHSGGSFAAVSVRGTTGAIAIDVRDDGNGFDPAAAGGGFGLIGMRERCALAGGRLDVSSSAAGTTISVVLPAVANETDAPEAAAP